MAQPHRPVKITTDSTCDLPYELLEKYDIDTLPLHVNLGDASYRDGADISPDMIFDYFEKTGNIAKTSAASTEEFREFFGKYTRQGIDVVHISIGQKLSCSYENAVIAAGELGGVSVVDSANLSTAVGHLAILGGEFAADGGGRAKIAEKLEAAAKKLDASFVIDTMEYLKAGGRCSPLLAFGANLLQIKPTIKVIGGAMDVGKKYRGALKKVLLHYVEDTFGGRADIDTRRLFITHTGCCDAILDEVKQHICERIAFDEIHITRAGSTITCHAGTNTLGVLFFYK